MTERQCQISNCTQPATVHVSFSDWHSVGGFLCARHKPTVEQALRRGWVADFWKIHGYYPHEIAARLTRMTGHTIRETTVRADLKWLGLTEAHRAAEARLDMAVRLGEAGPNVIALPRPRPA
jgi:hypothetical protein